MDHAQIRRYLELAGAYPLLDYVPVLEPAPEGLGLLACWPETTRGRIRFMARDDDIDYTILGLHILETHGFGFGPREVAAEWLDHLPFTRIYTAERVAYRNLVHGLQPPETATYRNPYREWIGAQIRADIWGYVSPGDPRQAAQLAFQDAALSHTANGIYGEMWSAALIAACFVAPDVRRPWSPPWTTSLPARGWPRRCATSLDLHARGWAGRRRATDPGALGHYNWVHTIPNAAVVAAGLLWGAGDFRDRRPGRPGRLGHRLQRRHRRVGVRRPARGSGPPAGLGRPARRPRPQRDRRLRKLPHLRPG